MVSFIETRTKELLQPVSKEDENVKNYSGVNKLPTPITDESLFNVLDKGLDALGASAKQAALWYYLEKDVGFQKQKGIRNINVFQETLQKNFG